LPFPVITYSSNELTLISLINALAVSLAPGQVLDRPRVS
jgi:hypothetical protein